MHATIDKRCNDGKLASLISREQASVAAASAGPHMVRDRRAPRSALGMRAPTRHPATRRCAWRAAPPILTRGARGPPTQHSTHPAACAARGSGRMHPLVRAPLPGDEWITLQRTEETRARQAARRWWGFPAYGSPPSPPTPPSSPPPPTETGQRRAPGTTCGGQRPTTRHPHSGSVLGLRPAARRVVPAMDTTLGFFWFCGLVRQQRSCGQVRKACMASAILPDGGRQNYPSFTANVT